MTRPVTYPTTRAAVDLRYSSPLGKGGVTE
jgi:hypothetical protein